MDDTGTEAGKLETFDAIQLRVQRSNMLAVCRMCVKSLVDKSAFECIGDDCPHLHNFCTIMEHILSHRLQARWSLFGSGDQVEFWEIITRFAPRASIASVHDMEEIQSDLGRGRAWIRLALVQKRLASFMHVLLSKQNTLRGFYIPGGFLVSEELTELAGNLRCLDAIDFNLCLKDQDFDFGDKKEIHYAPYLRFIQSRSSVIDDSLEEHRLLSKNSEKACLRELAGDEWEEDEGGGAIGKYEESQIVERLKETIKTERDQKNYFEELVSVRDSQLTRIKNELHTLTVQNETQRKSLEDIILELQTQMSKLEMDLREYQHKNHSQANDKEQNHSEATETSRKRATSFFAGLLGH